MKYNDTHSNVDSNVARIESSLLEIQKSEKNLCDLVKQLETQLHDHYKSVGSMFTDHVLGVDAKVTKWCETLASNSSSASSSVVVNVVQELENKEHRKKNVFFFHISEPGATNLEADCNYVSKLCKDTFDLDVKILKAFRLGKKVPNKCRPLLVQFEKENAKAEILGKSYLLKSMEPYSNVYVSVDMTKYTLHLFIQHHVAADKIHALAASLTSACYDLNIINLSLSTIVLGFRKSIPSS